MAADDEIRKIADPSDRPPSAGRAAFVIHMLVLGFVGPAVGILMTILSYRLFESSFTADELPGLLVGVCFFGVYLSPITLAVAVILYVACTAVTNYLPLAGRGFWAIVGWFFGYGYGLFWNLIIPITDARQMSLIGAMIGLVSFGLLAPIWRGPRC